MQRPLLITTVSLIVTRVSPNIAVNDFGAKKSIPCNQAGNRNRYNKDPVLIFTILSEKNLKMMNKFHEPVCSLGDTYQVWPVIPVRSHPYLLFLCSLPTRASWMCRFLCPCRFLSKDDKKRFYTRVLSVTLLYIITF